MEILFILGGLQVALIVTGWSYGRSYFEKGRRRGMEEATREFCRGLSLHYELEDYGVPARVAKAMKALKAISERSPICKGRLINITPHSGFWATGLARRAG